MTDDEIKLVSTLASDRSWSPLWPEDPYLIQHYLNDFNPHAPSWGENAADAQPLWFDIEEITSFLRYFCFWNDGSPRTSEMVHWLSFLSHPDIRLRDLTPEAWSRIIQTEAIKRLTQ